ncbi:transglycosylase domain-containing protein [Patescibacteria group bacterium]|nr:transglycosylase domain-containing protein [Patescibacteria group bacterium]MCL5797316.1 transglycosylase domain-containing protein [Patescibacteria group bacterium]
MKEKISYLRILSVFILIIIITSLTLFKFVIPPANMLTNELPQRFQIQIKKFHIRYVQSDKISQKIKDSALASQDKRFYSDSGIDLIGSIRALFFTFTSGKRQGASTITEQLAKNLYFDNTDNWQTDIKSKILALFITRKYSKNQIITIYLNAIYYGKHAYGIYNASETYFHTTPDKVTLPQATYLLALINAPSYLSANKDDAITRAEIVLSEMEKNKFISSGEEMKAKIELSKL